MPPLYWHPMCGIRPPVRESNDGELLILLFACIAGAILGGLTVVGPTLVLESVLPESILAWAQASGVWIGMGVGASWMGKKAFVEFFRPKA